MRWWTECSTYMDSEFVTKAFIHLGESLLFFKTVGTAWATSLLQEPWSQRSSWLVSTPSFKQPYTRRLKRFSSQNHCALMNDWFMFKAGPVWRKLKALIVHARRLIFGARFGLCLLLNMKFLSSQFLAQFCTYFFRLFGSWLLEHSETLHHYLVLNEVEINP